MNIILKNLNETIEFAKNFALHVSGGDILALKGDLGSGKTSFTKGLALGLGIQDEIKSPTFTLMNIYKATGSLKMVHIDTYRLENEKQLLEIGVEDYLGSKNTVVVIEWPEKISNLLKNKKVTEINFRHLPDNTREIFLSENN